MKTPQEDYPELAEALGIEKIFLKREDLHPYGSHKGRSTPTMITNYVRDGKEDFVVSSSGNAALAAIRKVKKHNEKYDDKISLKVFVGKKINEQKEKKLQEEIGQSEKITIEKTDRPKQTAFQLDKEDNVVYLRQSTDDVATFGYQELAQELDNIINLKALFLPTSSGTTAEGLADGFSMLKQNPQIHVVQTEYCHPIAKKFDDDFESSDEQSLASAIVDKVAHRKQRVVEIIKDTEGSGWVISDEKIKQAQDLVKEKIDLEISTNSALSIAGLQKAIENGCEWNGAVCCLVCGE